VEHAGRQLNPDNLRSTRVPSILRSRLFQWISTPLRLHLGAHTRRIAREYLDNAIAEHQRDITQLTSEVAVLSRRSYVQATNLAASVQLSETTRSQLADAREELAEIRRQITALREELAEVHAHGSDVGLHHQIDGNESPT
jgi:predicted  nucleic acid-binding Zn-ribbon protein